MMLHPEERVLHVDLPKGLWSVYFDPTLGAEAEPIVYRVLLVDADCNVLTVFLDEDGYDVRERKSFVCKVQADTAEEALGGAYVSVCLHQERLKRSSPTANEETRTNLDEPGPTSGPPC